MIDMNNKKTYSSPEVEMIKFNLSIDVLNVSDPASSVSQGSGAGLPDDPGVDPFGVLP